MYRTFGLEIVPNLIPLDGNAVKEIIDSLKMNLDDVGKIIDNCGLDPFPHSIAGQELGTFPRQESIHTALSQGSVLIETAADFIMGFCRVLKEPVQTIAPWSLARGVLESSAISAWLLDPKIDGNERVRRSFAFRFEGFSQQMKLARSTEDSTQLEHVIKRIEIVEKSAFDLGFEKVVNINGKRDGIGQRMPSITSLISEVLDKEPIYRLLSAMAHVHPWALQQGGFKGVLEDNQLFLTKHLKPISVVLLAIASAEAFYVSLRRKFEIFGWELDPIQQLLNDFYAVLDQFDKETAG